MNKSVYDNIIAGGIAGISNVYLTYPLRTVVKVQYVDGNDIIKTFKNILKNKSYRRFYSGINLTLVRVGLGRCCEAGTYTYYKNNNMPIGTNNQKFNNVSEISIITSLLKLSLSPLDTISNSYQVNGYKLGKDYIKKKYNIYGIRSLYYGFTPNLGISFIGHYIWFSSYSYMDYYFQNDKNVINNNILNKNIKNGIIGFSSSVLSDLIVNPSFKPVISLNSFAFKINFSPSKNLLSNGPITILTIAWVTNIVPILTIASITGGLFCVR